MRTIILKVAFPDFDTDEIEKMIDLTDEEFSEGSQIMGILGFDSGQVQLVACTTCQCPDEEHGTSVNAFPAYVVDARVEERKEFDEDELDEA